MFQTFGPVDEWLIISHALKSVRRKTAIRLTPSSRYTSCVHIIHILCKHGYKSAVHQWVSVRMTANFSAVCKIQTRSYKYTKFHGRLRSVIRAFVIIDSQCIDHIQACGLHSSHSKHVMVKYMRFSCDSSGEACMRLNLNCLTTHHKWESLQWSLQSSSRTLIYSCWAPWMEEMSNIFPWPIFVMYPLCSIFSFVLFNAGLIGPSRLGMSAELVPRSLDLVHRGKRTGGECTSVI
jgi:hypothetical protein